MTATRYADTRYVYDEEDECYYLPLVNGVLVEALREWVIPDTCDVHTADKLARGDLCRYDQTITDECVLEQLNCPAPYFQLASRMYANEANRCCCSGCMPYSWKTVAVASSSRNVINSHCMHCRCSNCVCDQRRIHSQYEEHAELAHEYASGCGTDKCLVCDS